MRDSDLLISRCENAYSVKVNGRANFEYAVPLRNLAKSGDEISRLDIDLAGCTAMDSTFMGVLTMLALKTRRNQVEMQLFNASETLQKLLRDLGVIKLFSFKTGDPEAADAGERSGSATALETAETVSEAHKILVDANEENRQKFSAVIDYAEADVERLRKAENK